MRSLVPNTVGHGTWGVLKGYVGLLVFRAHLVLQSGLRWGIVFLLYEPGLSPPGSWAMLRGEPRGTCALFSL